MLEELIESSAFPDESFIRRHLDKIYDVETLSNGKVRFWIERHPHLFGNASIGKASSAYIPISYQYELDATGKKVTLVKEEKGNPVIDYYALAMEEIDIGKEVGLFDFDDALQKLKTKDEAVRFAENKFEEFNWLTVYKSDETPLDFDVNFLKELRELFVETVLELWQEDR